MGCIYFLHSLSVALCSVLKRWTQKNFRISHQGAKRALRLGLYPFVEGHAIYCKNNLTGLFTVPLVKQPRKGVCIRNRLPANFHYFFFLDLAFGLREYFLLAAAMVFSPCLSLGLPQPHVEHMLS